MTITVLSKETAKVLHIILTFKQLPWFRLSGSSDELRIIPGQTKHLSRRDERREGQATFRWMSVLDQLGFFAKTMKYNGNYTIH